MARFDLTDFEWGVIAPLLLNKPRGVPRVDDRRLRTGAPWADIRTMPGRKTKPAFSRFLYRYRSLVERFFNKLKHFGAVATHYDKRPENDLAGVQLASIRIRLRFKVPVG